MIQIFLDNLTLIYVLVMMIILGFELVNKVPPVLHTPLMSGANAIHGVVIIGALLVIIFADDDHYISLILGGIAILLGTLNVVGGFAVTERMLEMFKNKKK